jgi:DNA topoisomerase IA
MNNSAHDDISIFDIDDLKNIADKDSRKIFQLIHDMQVSEQLGDAFLLRQDIAMRLNTQDGEELRIDFRAQMATTKGWLAGPLASFHQDKVDTCFTKEDIEAIKDGDFELSIDVLDTPKKMSLSELLEQMELFEVGRPSTIATIFDDLITKTSLIEISKERDEVSITQEGLEVYQLLQTELSEIANVDWNLHLMNLLSDVENGLLSPEIPLLMVFEQLYGHEARNKIQSLKWSDPDVLYTPPKPSSKQHGKIDISQKSDK